MVKTSSLNFNVKCRGCLSETQEMHHLFSEFVQEFKLIDIFKSTTNFDIEEDDVLPPYMCESCTVLLIDFFNFKTKFLENNDYLQSVYKTRNGNCNNSKVFIIKSSNSDTDELSQNEIELKEDITIVTECIENKDIIQQDILETNDPNINVEFLKCIKYYCEECNDYFLLKSDFQHHMLQTHEISITDFINISNTTSQITEEISIDDINENITLQCNICEENFKTYAKIAEHYKSSHKKYVCEHCGVAFSRKSCLKDHIEMHSKEKRHKCVTCGKAFKRRSVLAKHKRIHTHPRQCVCEICGLRFTDKGTLKTHIKLKHTKERDFECIICGQWFPLKSTLVKHIYRHDENRKGEYSCEICQITYKDKSSLNRHYLTKHTENVPKPSCLYCGKQYTTKSNLIKHVQKQHNSLNVKEPLLISKEIEIC